MQREIKFREYRGDGRWHYWGLMDEGKFVGPCSPKSKAFQYIGIKDKNGKEIYEGDIVKWTSIHNDSPKEHFDLMEWQDDSACFMLMPFVHEPSAAIMEVIGNILENQKLLKLASK